MQELQNYRTELDELDRQLIDILARRFSICREVAAYKARMAIPMMQPARVAEVKQRAAHRAAAHGLSEQFARDLYTLIIDEACRMEDEIIENAPAASVPAAH